MKSSMGQMTLLACVLLALYLSYESALPIGYREIDELSNFATRRKNEHATVLANTEKRFSA
jgi:hypothetical protein